MRQPELELSSGHSIPQIGFGVYKIPEEVTAAAVRTALAAGYRHIDTAALYKNEVGVGEGIRTGGVPRDDIFVTTKVWDTEHGYDRTLRAFDASMQRLGLDYLDLYLIHWPVPSADLYVETWHALEKLHDEGRVRSIGVSNFHPHHLERLAQESDHVPAVNQVEMHPWLPQDAVRAYDAAHGIVTEAWSPLARGRVLDDPVLAEIARKHGVTPAQVVIRWHLQRGDVVIPKSVTPARIESNIDVFGFELDSADRTALTSLKTGERTGQDPDEH